MSEELLLKAKEFFESYKKEIGRYAKEKKKSVIIDFSDLASFDPELAESILEKPEETIALMELALSESGLISDAKIRFDNLPETSSLKIREIRSRNLNNLIVIEGIVRQASEVRPQVINAKFECPSCGTVISVLQTDRKFREPSRCGGCGRRTGFKMLSKEMVDTQRLVIEESPESLIGGEQPRRISVFLKDDLVEPKMEEKTTPGSKIRVTGILKEVPIPLRTGAISTRFDLALEANNVIALEETFEELEISEEDEKQIREIASDPQVYEKLAASIAPSIFGYEEIKQALILQLLSGIRKKKSDGTWFRGDIHILLVGDPGVAKSVILKFISSIAPKGRYVIGKAATGAGLTAVVVRDEFLRGWSLEAGAMVLANKGIACIDELEKMTEQDRSAMHEALEQQTVSITKANVQATLRAETSVLAAANPKFGRFNPYQPIAQQIDLMPTLLNRFDLIFVMRDLPEKKRDEAIAHHVLIEHARKAKRDYIEPDLLRKFIAYVRQKIFPRLTKEAINEIKKFYVELRNAPVITEDVVRPIPISARQLEALIRLSEASAKARLSNKVTRKDARRAIEILSHSLMQVGFDRETKTIDIDRITTGVTASERSKIILVREAISRLESRLGKLVPISEIISMLEGKIDSDKVEEIIEKLKRSGDIFEPKKGYIQKI